MKTFLTLIISFYIVMDAVAQNYAAGTGAGNAGTDNTSVGTSAGDVITGTANAFFGYHAGKSATTGNYNVIIGQNSGVTMTTGSGNTRFGQANQGGTTGSNNTTAGWQAGYQMTTGAGNTFIGPSGYVTAGNNNVFLRANITSTSDMSNQLNIKDLILGDFSTDKLAINAALSSYTLNVGGVVNATALYVGGQLYQASQWDRVADSNTISYTAGGVSIGTATLPTGYKLAVAGKMISERVKIKLQGNWPDYVFEEDYKLLPLKDLKLYIAKNRHLPGVPDAKTIKEQGVSVGEMNSILVEKVEELTLHLLKMNERLEKLKKSQPVTPQQ